MNTETVLREALSSGADALDVPTDPWPGFLGRERTHRRNRRLRIAAAAVALVAAAGVQTGVVPLPGWAPGIAIAGRQTALTSASTRGNLAGDTAWLTGMRARFKDVRDPGELWKITSRNRIKFVYAADVPGHRLVLASVPLRFGFLTDQALIWYEGRPGAAPGEMTEAGRGDGGQTVVTWMSGSASAPGIAVVVAPPAARLAVSTGFRYTAEGRVERAKPVTSTGIAEVPVPAWPFEPGTTVVATSNGRTLYDGPLSGGWSSRVSDSDPTGAAGDGGLDPQEPAEATVTAALGRRSFDRRTLARWIANALHDARLPAAGTTVELRWTGTVNGQPAALITLQPEGGGVLAYATHGGADSFREDMRLLLPAAGADRRPIAWRMRAEGKDDRTDQVIVVTPPGTARATMNGAPLTLDASGAAFTALPPGAKASVTTYPADGSASWTTPVPPFETDSGGIPGDTPLTRVTG